MFACRMVSRLGSPLVLAALVACVRPPLTEACPEVQVGELVLTEFRGEQAGSYRQWIELYNASDDDVALAGLTVAFTSQDGDPLGRLIVRDPELVVAPGAYVVLGGGDPTRDAYIDYDYTGDWHSEPGPEDPPGAALEPKDIRPGGFVDLYACDTLVDRVLLRSLPEAGTLFWPGEPDAAGNDDGASWCADATSVIPTGTGVFGTPGEANPPCP